MRNLFDILLDIRVLKILKAIYTMIHIAVLMVGLFVIMAIIMSTCGEVYAW
jgi:hypothetical protein